MLKLCPRRFRWDVAERTFWTAVEGGVAGGVTWAGDLPSWAMFPLLVLAAFAKAFIAGKVGQTNTASTLSLEKDPAAVRAVSAVPPVG
jgi:hypothetical protein